MLALGREFALCLCLVGTAMVFSNASAQYLQEFSTESGTSTVQRTVTVRMRMGPVSVPPGFWYMGPPVALDFGDVYWTGSPPDYWYVGPPPVRESFQLGIIALAGDDPLIRPIQLRLGQSPSGPWTPLIDFPLDGRTPAEKANAAQFVADVNIQESGSRYLVTGEATNLNLANARIQYWDGTGWRDASGYGVSPFQPGSGHFLAYFPRTSTTPMVRVISLTAPPGTEGYSSMRGSIRTEFPRSQAPPARLQNPANRFNIRTRSGWMGVRG